MRPSCSANASTRCSNASPVVPLPFGVVAAAVLPGLLSFERFAMRAPSVWRSSPRTPQQISCRAKTNVRLSELLDLIDVPRDAPHGIPMRLRSVELVSNNAGRIDVEGRGNVVEPHTSLRFFGRQPRHRERELHLAEVPLEPLVVLVDADQQKCHIGIALIP